MKQELNYIIPQEHTALLATATQIVQPAPMRIPIKAYSTKGGTAIAIHMDIVVATALELLPNRRASIIQLPCGEWALVLTRDGYRIYTQAKGTRAAVSASGLRLSPGIASPAPGFITENIVRFSPDTFTTL